MKGPFSHFNIMNFLSLHGSIVCISTLSLVASAPAIASEEKDMVKSATLFEISGSALPVSKIFFGAHDAKVFGVGRVSNHTPDDQTALIKDIGFQILRGPDGTPANYYDWKEGRPINSTDPSFEKIYGKERRWEHLVPKEGYPPLTLADIYKPAEELNLPYVFDLNVCSASVEEIVEQVREMRKLTSKPIRVELGNEIYAMMYSPIFPLVSDYIEKSKKIYDALKELDPSIQIAIVGVGADLEGRVLGDPKNQPSGDTKIDFEATQSGRIAVWNKTLKENPDIYDAVTVHISPPINAIDQLSPTALMQYLFAFNIDSLRGLNKQAKYFGKELWITEWGYFPGALLKETGKARDKMNFMKTPGMAIAKADRILSMLQAPGVTMTAYHDLNSRNGFGVVQRSPDGTLLKLPNYYVFKAMGDLLKKSPYVHPVESKNNPAERIAVLYTRNTVDLPNVAALGFGGKDKPDSIVFINHTGIPQTVEVKNHLLKTTWIYGGGNPLPDYRNNPVSFAAPPSENPEPETLEELPAQSVALKPYSMTICSLQRN